MDAKDRRWDRAIIVGASSGIGAAIAQRLAARGTRVMVVARRGERLARLCEELNRTAGSEIAQYLTHDVRETADTAVLFQQAATLLGGLDLVVYAAGILPAVQPGEYPTGTDVNTIETNLSGAIAWLNEAAMRFARARAGTIIGISSVAGDRGRVGNPVYNATKAGLNSYLASLRNRLARYGITVTTAKPGIVRTEMINADALPKFIPVPNADEVAARILAAAAAEKRVVYVPWWWRPVMLAVRAIPAPVFERLKV